MKAEFLKDQNDDIWLSYVSDIQIRRSTKKVGLQDLESAISEEKMKKVKAIQKA